MALDQVAPERVPSLHGRLQVHPTPDLPVAESRPRQSGPNRLELDPTLICQHDCLTNPVYGNGISLLQLRGKIRCFDAKPDALLVGLSEVDRSDRSHQTREHDRYIPASAAWSVSCSRTT